MNQDHLQRFPNQLIERRPTECAGETVADLIGNLTGIPMDADYNYAAALKVMDVAPSDAGSDPYSAMLGGLVYGALPTEKEPFDATTQGEVYVANFANYPLEDKQLSLAFAQKGVVTLHSYAETVDWLSQNKGGVNLALKWYQNFNNPQSNGLLTEPTGQFTYHDTAVYEATPLGLRVKPWLGPEYNYCFLNEHTFDEVFMSAHAYDPKSWRWLSLARTAVTHTRLIPDILPQMRSAMIKNV